MDNNSFTLREGKFVLWVGIICGALNLIILAFALPSTILQQDYVGAWFCGVIFGGFAILGAILILAYMNRKLYISLENCKFTNIFSRKKEFLWSDISYAKQSLTNFTFSLRLYNKDGKRIVQIESTMPGAERLLALLREQDIKIISPIEEMTKHVEQQRSLSDKDIPWQLENQTTIRKINLWLLAISIASAVLYFVLPTRLGMALLTVSTILPYVLMLTFPQVIIPNLSNRTPREWKKSHVEFGYLAFFLPQLIILTAARVISFVPWQPAFIFGCVLYAILATLYFLRTPKYLRKMGNAICILIFLVMFCFSSTYSINYALNFKSIHEPVTILDTYSSAGRNTSYYVTYQRPNELTEDLSTSQSTYKLAKSGSSLRRCQRKSIFGITFIALHK